MMVRLVKLSPPSSILFVSDISNVDVPEIGREGVFWWTKTCIAFGCRMEQDGDTEVTIGEIRDVDPRRIADFQSMLATPTRNVVVSTSEGEVVLKINVSNVETQVQIWIDHPTEPEKVIIGVE